MVPRYNSPNGLRVNQLEDRILRVVETSHFHNTKGLSDRVLRKDLP